jgi:hypothetical protein
MPRSFRVFRPRDGYDQKVLDKALTIVAVARFDARAEELLC